MGNIVCLFSFNLFGYQKQNLFIAILQPVDNVNFKVWAHLRSSVKSAKEIIITNNVDNRVQYFKLKPEIRNLTVFSLNERNVVFKRFGNAVRKKNENGDQRAFARAASSFGLLRPRKIYLIIAPMI